MKNENVCIIKCEICGYESSRLGSHVSQYHKIRPKDYYDKHLKKENEGKCAICYKDAKFYGIRYGYSRTCGMPHCVSKLGTMKEGWSEYQSAKMKAKWLDDEYKNNVVTKMAASIQKKWDEDIEYREKCSKAFARKWKDKNYRDKNRESMSIAASKRIARVGNGHSDRNYKAGIYFSEKNDKNVYYASSYELKAFERLEKDDNVTSYERPRIAIKYVRPDDNRMHRYVPDILAVRADGNKTLIEIKPESMLLDEITKSKIIAAQLYSRKKNYDFAIWTEKELENGSQ